MINNQTDPILEATKAHRALAILQLLNGSLRGAGNERLLASLLEVVGLRLSRDEMRELLEFLARIGAVATTDADGIMVVALKHRGYELANGLATAEGIEKPTPGLSY